MKAEIVLPEPTKLDLKDEIAGITAHLIVRHNMTLRGLRMVAKRAHKSGKVRRYLPLTGTRIATAEDLLGDLERCVVDLRSIRMTMAAVAKGARLAAED